MAKVAYGWVPLNKGCTPVEWGVCASFACQVGDRLLVTNKAGDETWCRLAKWLHKNRNGTGNIWAVGDVEQAYDKPKKTQMLDARRERKWRGLEPKELARRERLSRHAKMERMSRHAQMAMAQAEVIREPLPTLPAEPPKREPAPGFNEVSALRFWKLVGGKTESGCQMWLGPMHGDEPVFMVGMGARFNAQSVAMRLVTGHWIARPYTTCGHALCVSPDHVPEHNRERPEPTEE